MKEIRHLKTMKNKRNLNTKWLLLQNDQNADTTLLHSHDEIGYKYDTMRYKLTLFSKKSTFFAKFFKSGSSAFCSCV